MQRTDKAFRVNVVEPYAYDPPGHAFIFDSVLTALVSPPQERFLDPFRKDVPHLVGEPFDLITFPEAFLPAERLVTALRSLSVLRSLGCVHVGLRPAAEGSHLFTVRDLRALIESLLAVANLEHSDLDNFTTWLDTQGGNARLNIGCLFTIDAMQRLRICLHPKLQRSKFEFTTMPETFMTEGSLLSVVTLKPTDKRFLTLSIQPLICSDALLQNPDRPGSRPLEAVHLDANCLGDSPPDHIDVVSVAACTPQDEALHPKKFRVWKTAFKDAFHRAVTDASMSRHRFATFVLSNFGRDPNQGPAGLSGTFFPMKPSDTYSSSVSTSCWGWPKGETDPRWSLPIEDYSEWTVKGQIASINPFSEGADAAVRIFGFRFSALPRDMSPWSPQPAIGYCSTMVGNYASDQSITFIEATNG